MSTSNDNKLNTSHDNTADDTSRRIYGAWTDKRIIVFINSMIKYHPFDRRKKEVAKAKENVMDSVNRTDLNVNPIHSWSTFQNKLDVLIEQVTNKQTNAHTPTVYDFDSQLEEKVLILKQLVSIRIERGPK